MKQFFIFTILFSKLAISSVDLEAIKSDIINLRNNFESTVEQSKLRIDGVDELSIVALKNKIVQSRSYKKCANSFSLRFKRKEAHCQKVRSEIETGLKNIFVVELFSAIDDFRKRISMIEDKYQKLPSSETQTSLGHSTARALSTLSLAVTFVSISKLDSYHRGLYSAEEARYQCSEWGYISTRRKQKCVIERTLERIIQDLQSAKFSLKLELSKFLKFLDIVDNELGL